MVILCLTKVVILLDFLGDPNMNDFKFFFGITYPLDFSDVVFPMVRSVFSTLISSDMISVQPMGLPMELPSGFSFYFDFGTVGITGLSRIHRRRNFKFFQS